MLVTRKANKSNRLFRSKLSRYAVSLKVLIEEVKYFYIIFLFFIYNNDTND